MKNINILVLEDEIFSFMNIDRSLKKMGFNNIFLAKNENELNNVLSEHKIDLIFSDIKLSSSKDGIDLILDLEESKNIPVVFISASQDNETYIKTSKIRNFAGFLVKPYREEDLKAITLITISKYNLDCELIIIDKSYTYNRNTKSLYFNSKIIDLSKKETSLLDLLMSNLNHYISISIIEEYLWDKSVNDSTRRTTISRFKQKVPALNVKTKKDAGIGIFI
jgi:DNA-binding response OmpR family regulator